MKDIEIYTDGSGVYSRGNDLLPGGFAFVALAKGLSGEVLKRTEKFGWASRATSNQMELAAIYVSLMLLKVRSGRVTIYTDSEYSKNCLTAWYKKWERSLWINSTGEKVKNAQIIEATVERIRELHGFGVSVGVRHIRGHSGIIENERADFLAGRARRFQVTNMRRPVVVPLLNVHKHTAPERRVSCVR